LVTVALKTYVGLRYGLRDVELSSDVVDLPGSAIFSLLPPKRPVVFKQHVDKLSLDFRSCRCV